MRIYIRIIIEFVIVSSRALIRYMVRNCPTIHSIYVDFNKILNEKGS